MSKIGRLAVFIAVIGLVVVGAAAVGFIAADRPAEATGASVDNEYYTDESVVADAQLEPRSGEIELEAGPSRTVAIATDGPVSELDPVVTSLVDAGHEVRIVGGQSPLQAGIPLPGVQPAPVADDEADLVETLDESDAFLVVGNTQFDDDEREAIEDFVESDGRFVVATDDESADADLTSLTSGFGVAVGDGYLYDMAENDANYQRIYGTGTGPLSDDNRFVFDRVSPVSGTGETVVSIDGEDTRHSVTRERGSFDVAVRTDTVMLVGDSNIYAPLNYNRGDNEALVSETLTFLTDGPADPYSADPEAEQEPSQPPQEPTEPPREAVEE